MKTILIDLSSIQKNPDFGKDRIYQPGPMEILFTCVGPLPSSFIGDKNCFITELTYFDVCFYKGTLNNLDLLSTITPEEWKRVTVTINRQPVILETKEKESEYLYQYLSELLMCKECGYLFPLADLEYETAEYTDDTNDRVCPNCGSWNCVDIEYETIEEALKRKENGDS